MTTKQLKTELLQCCNKSLETRLEKIKQTVLSIEESLFAASKSSAGDKHQTSRAMLQIDRENAGKQLLEIEKLQSIIKRVKSIESTPYVRLGSLVYTNTAIYFISISVGKVIVNGTNYFCIAIQAPIAQLLLGKTKGDSVVFNEKEIVITNVE